VSATTGLKAAACAVLSRNTGRNAKCNDAEKGRNFHPSKRPLELRSVAPLDWHRAAVADGLAEYTDALTTEGYRFKVARVRRELANAAGLPSLRAMKGDVEAWRRASAVVDKWIARLAADARRGPLT